MFNEKYIFADLTFLNNIILKYIKNEKINNGIIENKKNNKYIFFIKGLLTARRYSVLEELGITQTSYPEIITFLRSLPDRSTCFFLIDSGGGYLWGLDNVIEEIKKAKERGIIINSIVRSLCASAAYMIAANTSKIYANALSTVGSIGVYSIFLDVSEAQKLNGVIYHLVSSGPLKGAELPEIEKTDKFLTWEQRNIDDIFIWVKENIPREIAPELYEGGVVMGGRALEYGLIDEMYKSEEDILNNAFNNFNENNNKEARHMKSDRFLALTEEQKQKIIDAIEKILEETDENNNETEPEPEPESEEIPEDGETPENEEETLKKSYKTPKVAAVFSGFSNEAEYRKELLRAFRKMNPAEFQKIIKKR